MKFNVIRVVYLDDDGEEQTEILEVFNDTSYSIVSMEAYEIEIT